MENEMTTRDIIDYAQDQNGVEFRSALYSAIHDKVTAHIEAQKQSIAQTMMAPLESEEPVEPQQETEIENT
jgi:hypothetical protein